MVAARFKRHIGGGTRNIVSPGLSIHEGDDLSMGISGPRMRPLPENAALLYQHAAYRRIGTGEAHAPLGLLQGQRHEMFISRKQTWIRKGPTAGQIPGKR